MKNHEKLVTRKLIIDHVTNNNLFDDNQCSFEKNRSTIDQITKFQQEILYEFIMKQYTVGIFFNTEKAFDRIFKICLIKNFSST